MRRGKIQPLFSREEKKSKTSLGTSLCLQDLLRNRIGTEGKVEDGGVR